MVLAQVLLDYPDVPSLLAKRALKLNTSLWDSLQAHKLMGLPTGASAVIDSFLRSLHSARGFLTAGAALAHVCQETEHLESLLSSIDGDGEVVDSARTGEDNGDEPSGVRFMTLHSSKGLEADFVFIPFMEESLGLPAADVEESRRLLYVAMTRAKVGAIFSWAWSRRSGNRFKCAGTGGAPTGRRPSPFITECGIKASLCRSNATPSPADIAIEILTEHALAVAAFDKL